MKTFWNTYKSSILLLAAMVAGGVIGFFWGPGEYPKVCVNLQTDVR
jgi:hypothetical protein